MPIPDNKTQIQLNLINDEKINCSRNNSSRSSNYEDELSSLEGDMIPKKKKKYNAFTIHQKDFLRIAIKEYFVYTGINWQKQR